MATDIQWSYITDKYSLVEMIDSAIVVAKFNQQELQRDLIEVRCKVLESESYEELLSLLNVFLEINGNITDKQLAKIIEKLIDHLTSFRDASAEFKEELSGTVESKVSD